MKRSTLTTEKTLTVLFILIAVFSFTFHGCKPAQKQMAEDSNPFINGETLAPDYAHDDSLIVINADKLNEIFDGVNVALLPTTDGDISDTLHKYCIPVNSHVNNSEYQFNVDQTGYDIYSDGKLIGRLNYGANPSLDSLIDKDNY